MYLYLFLLLLSCRASSYFIPLKEMPFLQKINKTTIIEEMICLLDAEKPSSNGYFKTPTFLKNRSCAHNNTNMFIEELKKLNISVCMTIVKEDMCWLEKSCSVLKEEKVHANNCKHEEVNFSEFKSDLEEFLKWVNETLKCNSTVRYKVDLDANNCTCPRLQSKGWP